VTIYQIYLDGVIAAMTVFALVLGAVSWFSRSK
jgi:hypothetical protein